MKIEMWPVDRLKPYERNPRKIPERAIEKVAESLKAFGFQQPIVVDTKDVLIVGHTRLKGAIRAGFREVPVHVADKLTPAQVRAYRIADNRTNEETDWLDDALIEELKAIEAEDEALLDALGFEDRELQKLMEDTAELEAAEETPEVPVDPVSVPGDVWVMGAHRIVCGDSTEAHTVGLCLNGVVPNLMVTDPPYGVNYDPSWRLEAKQSDGRSLSTGNIASGKVLNDDKADWTAVWALFPGNIAYVWHGALHSNTVADNLVAAGFTIRAQIIWAKSSLVIGRGDYHWQHEPCWYAVRKKGDWKGDRKQTTLWQIETMHRTQGNVDDGKTVHGTQRPVECMRRPIMNNSSPGQAIYEPFSGSGTTLIACEMTGRNCHAIELNPAYVDVAVTRWQKFAGGDAIHEETGLTFSQIADQRLKENPESAARTLAAVNQARKDGAVKQSKPKKGKAA